MGEGNGSAYGQLSDYISRRSKTIYQVVWKPIEFGSKENQDKLTTILKERIYCLSQRKKIHYFGVSQS